MLSHIGCKDTNKKAILDLAFQTQSNLFPFFSPFVTRSIKGAENGYEGRNIAFSVGYRFFL